MFKSVLLRIVIPYILGIFLFFNDYNLVISATIVALFLVYVFVYKRDLHIFILFVILGIFIAFISSFTFKNKTQKIENENAFIGVVTSITLDNKSCIVRSRDYKLKLFLDNDVKLSVGDKIEVTGNSIKDINYKKLYSKNINAYIKVTDLKKTGTNRGYIIELLKLSDRFKRNLNAIDSKSGGIINGLLTGDTEGLDQYTKDVLKDLNLSHIVVVSGSHLGILAVFTVIIFASNFKLRYIF
ncbi:ComEC/Rec2 family competence protein [Caloramator sp. mosi_1]|uniref:ComEC/Rec2 family competence protein n=1 Tax=Caloramator sp. mosi_1 TaxID=3023090 RepID=UPI00235E3C66|nr:ComEC/Rec2 family competence protein [Caloramator sp. mosi_1]WDC83895.1 ComEC/Rec2 family competence protein [Caloramator sp. mosi_1]